MSGKMRALLVKPWLALRQPTTDHYSDLALNPQLFNRQSKIQK